jgi:ATP-dependent DNA helicase DinG
MELCDVGVLPPPCELGAPERFKEWRAEQVDAVMRLTDSPLRHACYNMPTGSGKSVTAVMAGRMLDVRTLILTSTKALQQQYLKDQLSEADVRGQQNYECVAVRRDGALREFGGRRSWTGVDRGPCHVGVKCWMKIGGCPYFDAVRYSLDQQIITTNYSYWLAVGKALKADRGVESLGKFGLLVLDEAHAAVDEACAALRIELPRGELSGLLNIRPLELDAPVDKWRVWGTAALRVWADEMDRATQAMRGSYVDPDIVAEYRELQRLGTALEEVSKLSGDWVVGESWRKTHVTFDPVWPTAYTEGLLFRGVPRVLLTSATITQKTLDILGVPTGECEYVEYPSTFDVARRPVYILRNAPRVDYRMDEATEGWWVSIIDNFLRTRLEAGRKGIVHCVSYARMNRLVQLSQFRDHFIVNKDGTQTQHAIERFKTSSDPVVLVSPSVTTGEDFPYDECRFVIIPKLPFIDTRDPIAKKREASMPGYGGYLMMNTLVQSSGRGMRAADDWCETIVVDGHAQWAMPKFKEYAPAYFRDSWRWVNALPEPLDVE